MGEAFVDPVDDVRATNSGVEQELLDACAKILWITVSM